MPRKNSYANGTAGSAPTQQSVPTGTEGEQVRLSLNVNRDVADVLRGYAQREGVSVTEATRRAVSVFKYVDDAQQRGASMAVKEPDDRIVEIRFV